MVMGRFHGYPDVYPWHSLKVISVEEPAGGDAATIDLFDEVGSTPRGFILSAAINLDCIAWGNYVEGAASEYQTVPFIPGTYFGSLRSIRTKGTGGTTTGDATSITFFV